MNDVASGPYKLASLACGNILMRLLPSAIAISLSLATGFAHAAGIQLIEVPAGSEGRSLSGAVWYPCSEPAQRVRLHGLSVPGVQDCAGAGDKLPLIVISHGRSGWYGGHHDTAAALADAGFVAVAINHPGDNAFDTSRIDDLSLAIERPNDIRRAIDFMTTAWPNAAKIDSEHIGFFGFSKGAYTGLAVIGGHPNFKRGVTLRAHGEIKGPCEALATFEIPREIKTRDARVKAAVLADPAITFLFGPDDLNDVTVPIEIWSSELGGAGVTRDSVTNVSRRLPAQPPPHLVAHAGHWAFLAPCSAGQAAGNARICVDAPEFDRAAFHQSFNAELVTFFRAQFGVAPKP
jgi:predicted dienelactone hydrolase